MNLVFTGDKGTVRGMIETLAPENLVIGPRPGKKSFQRLSELELTHCCTLLNRNEEPFTIKKICDRLGCDWIWLPVTGGGLEALETTPMAQHLRQLNAALEGVGAPKIYLHCSAGLHRTGYVGYILLRLMGLDETAAFEALKELRPITAEEVGADRIALAEAFVRGYKPLST